MSEVKCPTCGKEDFSNENYMKRHHKLKHDESLVEKYECSVDGCDNKTRNPKFCSDECMSKARRQYEESECKNLECDEEVYKKEYCSRDCANSHTWRNRDNAAKRDEVREKLSEMRTGEKNPFYGEKHTKEALKKISESQTGEKHHFYGVTGKDHPSYGVASGLKLQTVEETGHTVRSNWEKEIDLMLHEAGIDYKYEPKTFELPKGNTYTPDFIIRGEIVIEVKGWPDDKSKKRAELFMQEYPEYQYMVVGNEIPCERFVSWNNRSNLIELLKQT
ncbi:MAG: NUMOD3 domain-containing DNA-binding protein [Candidatus Nanohalobium sp.]